MIDIDLGSVETDNADAIVELKRRSWFDVAQFPQATFVSTGAKAVGKDQLEISGDLTIKGQSRPIKIGVRVSGTGKSRWFQGAFTISRLQFAVGSGVWADTTVVADAVQVNFKLLQK